MLQLRINQKLQFFASIGYRKLANFAFEHNNIQTLSSVKCYVVKYVSAAHRKCLVTPVIASFKSLKFLIAKLNKTEEAKLFFSRVKVSLGELQPNMKIKG